MRPLRLSLEGFRSYRQRQEIKLDEIELLAITGVTGSGKSTILIAISFCLWKKTSWSERDVTPLIADGMHTMTVELDFEVAGNVYRVTRSSSRSQSPPAISRLQCLTDPKFATLDRESDVDAAVERLLGMTYRVFKSAVALPQGDFQVLLNATPADRTGILKGIFHLGEIEEVRRRSEVAKNRAQGLIADLAEARQQYMPDPAKTAAESAQLVAAAEKRSGALQRIAEKVTVLGEQSKATSGAARVLDEPLQKLTRSPRPAAALMALLPLADKFASDGKAASTALAAAQAAETKAADIIEKARARRVGPEDLAAASATLDQIQRNQAATERDERELTVAKGKLTEERAALSKFNKELPRLQKEYEAATAKETKLSNQHQALTEAYQAARNQLAECRRLHNEQKLAVGAIASNRSDEKELSKKAVTCDRQATGLRNALAKAEAAREASLLATAAATAGRAVKPGDPCPICDRTLPPHYHPPSAPPDGANEVVRQAQVAARQAEAALSAANAKLTGAQDELKKLTTRSDELGQLLSAALSALRRSVPGAALESTDALLLQPFVDRGKVARTALDAAKPATTEALRRLSAAQTQSQQRAEQLVKDEAAHKDRQAKIAAARKQALDDLIRIATLIGAPDKADTASAPLTAKLLATRREDMQGRVESLEAARAAVKNAQKSERDLHERYEREVNAPATKLIKDAELLKQRLDDVLAVLGRKASPDIDGGAGLGETAKRIERIESVATEAESRGSSEVNALTLKASELDAQVNSVLVKEGMKDRKALDQAVIAAAATMRSAEKDHRLASAQIKPAAALDASLAAGRQFVVDLEELGRLTTDNQFIRHIIDSRQRNLLAVASQLLGAMSNDQFGFAPDFQVVHRITNQSRPRGTLSGGETFLASLALALALVEIAARAGGKLDALFLDEGFGTLDANSLDEAMSVLESRAQSGRLVVVVSHIKAVAERIPTVLHITKTAAGSRAEFVSADERGKLVEAELEEHLLA